MSGHAAGGKPVAHTRAYSMVREALQSGALVRPSRCSRCGVEPGRTRNGAAKIQAHHHRGYERPLDVEWLCVLCHRHETPSNPRQGEQVSTSKLTAANVVEIRTSDLSTNALARKFGVSRGLVFQVRAHLVWRHVETCGHGVAFSGGSVPSCRQCALAWERSALDDALKAVEHHAGRIAALEAAA